MMKIIILFICTFGFCSGMAADVGKVAKLVPITADAILSDNMSILVLYSPATGAEAIRLFMDVDLDENKKVSELAKIEGLFASKFKNLASVPDYPEHLYDFIRLGLSRTPQLLPHRGKAWFGVTRVDRILEDFNAYRIVLDKPDDTFVLLESKEEIQYVVDKVMPGLNRIYKAVKEGQLAGLGEDDFSNLFVRQVFLAVVAHQLAGEKEGSE